MQNMRNRIGQSGRHGFTMVEMPFDRSTSPFDKLTVPSIVEGLAAACREPPSRAMRASNRELRVVRQTPRRVVRKCKGGAFTLIELLVVIALIAMLASILTVALVTARRTSVRLECQSKLNQIGQMIQQLSLDNAGFYPMLEQTPDLEGRYPALRPPIPWPQPNNSNGIPPTPWWVRVYQQTPGASIDADATTPGIQPPAQLPLQMQMFHCRNAPALDRSNLNGTLSYGLNFDTKRVDGKAYKWSDGANDFVTDAIDGYLGPRTGQANDKDPDQVSYTQIKQPSEFILLSEGNAGEVDADNDGAKERCGYRIAAQEVWKAGEPNNLHPAAVVGRHKGEANVLFADQHVELRWADLVEAGDMETRNINLDTPLWTLPAD